MSSNSYLPTENYALQFWTKLRQEIRFFDHLPDLSFYMEDKDLMSVRDLYKKIKTVLS